MWVLLFISICRFSFEFYTAASAIHYLNREFTSTTIEDTNSKRLKAKRSGISYIIVDPNDNTKIRKYAVINHHVRVTIMSEVYTDDVLEDTQTFTTEFMIISTFKAFKIDRKTQLHCIDVLAMEETIESSMLLISDIRGAYCFAPKSLNRKVPAQDKGNREECLVLDHRLFCGSS